jgi:hypothetical protein
LSVIFNLDHDHRVMRKQGFAGVGFTSYCRKLNGSALRVTGITSPIRSAERLPSGGLFLCAITLCVPTMFARMMRALNRHIERVFDPSRKDTQVFATPEAADEWFQENDTGGVAFGHEVLG